MTVTKINTPYWDHECNEFIVQDEAFLLPSEHTFSEPPFGIEGFHRVLIGSTWHQIPECKAYAKDRIRPDFWTHELAPIPSSHTFIKPGPYDTWRDETNSWQYSEALQRPNKTESELDWRNSLLVKVLDRIDQYEKDQSYPSGLRTSPFTIEQYNLLLLDRKLLSDYPNVEGFPFCERPTLSGLAT
ncbi:hypothetical protein AB4154_11550 [Vibrio sp. 10N.286.51.B11]|uniref:hypothetical protein n=1 Tax=Vibrio sp. 10N.286.51.B11 TaxID=3229706 RepID=UPI00354F4E33